MSINIIRFDINISDRNCNGGGAVGRSDGGDCWLSAYQAHSSTCSSDFGPPVSDLSSLYRLIPDALVALQRATVCGQSLLVCLAYLAYESCHGVLGPSYGASARPENATHWASASTNRATVLPAKGPWGRGGLVWGFLLCTTDIVLYEVRSAFITITNINKKIKISVYDAGLQARAVLMMFTLFKFSHITSVKNEKRCSLPSANFFLLMKQIR